MSNKSSAPESEDEWYLAEEENHHHDVSSSKNNNTTRDNSQSPSTSQRVCNNKNGAVPGVLLTPAGQALPTRRTAPPVTRTELPVQMFSRKDFSVWTFLKQCIGKELSKITMPVIFNEPLSFVQRVAEYMEYGDLLLKGAACSDPVQRMEYVAAFAVSSAASNWDRVGKPFNPLLGETYELTREDLGFRLVCEQVSHHPPVSAFCVESPQYTFHGSIHPKLKFWGKSIEVTPKGTVTLTFHEHGETYTWSNIICCVHNIIVGKLWIEHYGTMEIVNHKTGHKAVLHFKPSGWFGKDLHKIEGYIYNNSKKKVRAFYGKWIDSLYSHDVKSYEKWRDSTGGSHSAPPHDSKTHRKSKDSTGSSSGRSEQSMSGPSTPSSEVPDDDVDEIPLVRLSSCDLQLYDERLLWQANPRPTNSQKYYNFTNFALSLNELRPANIKDIVAPTDSRLRPDIRKLEEGDLDGASNDKHRMEEKQRAVRKRRKETGEKWKPLWFSLQVNRYTGKEDWLYTGKYWDKKWDKCPPIF